ncbi:urease-associated protein [Pararhizobium polonicum]|uniref:Urease-associated protein n=1 Tax=Pararhizobium polonicum TaxID=1612624 RepID=A0A1C7NVA3_9HYPH|nr:TIGR02117 family protein [Pararhizobium polonicum]OBZ92626.1 urease-associated protein [Pararhizobium polonicum]
MFWKRPVRWLVAVVLAAVLAAVAGTMIPRPLWPVAKADMAAAETHRILVLSNPIHTDIAIPIDAETLARFPFLAESGMPVDHPNARWLIFGWGGRAFYIETPTWAELKPVPLIKGLTVDRSVIHADVAGEIVEPSDRVAGFEIGTENYQRLLSFIEASFTPMDGRIEAIPGTAYGPNDRFFEANGWFSAAVGCNTWTAKALREAGLRTGWWNPLPVSLTTSLSLYN